MKRSSPPWMNALSWFDADCIYSSKKASSCRLFCALEIALIMSFARRTYQPERSAFAKLFAFVISFGASTLLLNLIVVQRPGIACCHDSHSFLCDHWFRKFLSLFAQLIAPAIIRAGSLCSLKSFFCSFHCWASTSRNAKTHRGPRQ